MRLNEVAALLILYMFIEHATEPFGFLRAIAFGLGALILISWKGK